MLDDRAYWVALTRFRGFGPIRMGKISRRFTDMRHAFEASVSQLLEAGIEPEIAHRFLQERLHMDPLQEWQRMEQQQVRAITIKDEDYPPLLKQLYDPPAVLFVRGSLPPSTLKHLAVVGSRNATSYGTRAVEQIVDPLARSGVVIVSGLAQGIDACAHHVCLQANGITLAVLGSGVDHESIYPSQHRTLASMILAKGGALLSEYPLGTPPLKQHFPLRNRIIAGLSHGVLVVEGALKSGSLITAQSAMEAGRDVYAIPGSIHAPLSEGPNQLIKQGAVAVTHATDIFDITLRPAPTQPRYEPQNEEESRILQTLQTHPLHLDEIVRASELPIQVASSTMTILEMKGVARHEGGRYYSKTSL